MKFGEYLLKNDLVPEHALSEGLETQRFRREKLGRVLRNLGYLTQAELDQYLYQHTLPKETSSLKNLSEALKARLLNGSFNQEVKAWAEDKSWIPFEESETGITFLAPFFRDDLIEEAESRFKKASSLIVVSHEAMNLIRMATGIELPRDQASKLKLEVQVTDDQKIGMSDPYTSLFRDAVLAARDSNASDIHIQPMREGIAIRFRINGDMETWKELKQEHQRSFINEVKRLTNLSIGISGRAQDGRVSFKNWQLDLRTSLLPSQYGEKVVLRLLDLNRRFNLAEIGFDPGTHQDLLQALRSKNGVIIISGPTGSGKTTTLYTLLCALDRNAKNIITLEDPIEYGIDGLTQVQVSKKLSFSEALRSVLRQDPDVILVGEIRDAETADLCVKAASTGHLVLSTLHANGAAEVVSRMMNLGIDPYMLKSVLRFSAAQRLLKKICPECSILEEHQAVETSLQKVLKVRFVPDPMMGFKKINPKGCPACKAGVSGRIPILEYMCHPEIIDYLAAPGEKPPSLSVSLREATLRRAEKGEVDYHEVLEVE